MSIGSQVTEQIIRESTKQAHYLSDEEHESWYRFRLAELIDTAVADLQRDLAGREAGMRILERCLEARVAEVATLQGRIAALTGALQPFADLLGMVEGPAFCAGNKVKVKVWLPCGDIRAASRILTTPGLALMKRSKAMERVVDAARDAIGTDGTGKPCFQPDYKYAPPVADALAALDRVTP
jgi:hypothetical protein